MVWEDFDSAGHKASLVLSGAHRDSRSSERAKCGSVGERGWVTPIASRCFLRKCLSWENASDISSLCKKLTFQLFLCTMRCGATLPDYHIIIVHMATQNDLNKIIDWISRMWFTFALHHPSRKGGLVCMHDNYVTFHVGAIGDRSESAMSEQCRQVLLKEFCNIVHIMAAYILL